MISTPPEKRLTPLRKLAHRHGVARGLSRLHGPTGGGWGLIDEHVETALPWKWLARYAARHYNLRITEVERYGRLRRRWRLKPVGSRAVRDRARRTR